MNSAPEIVELQNLKAELDRQIQKLNKAERPIALEQIREWIERFSFTRAELFPVKKSQKHRYEAPPKYRDPITEETWDGKGAMPERMIGRDKSIFEVNAWEVK